MPARFQETSLLRASIERKQASATGAGGLEGDLESMTKQPARPTMVVRLRGGQQMDEGGITLDQWIHQGLVIGIGERQGILQAGDQLTLGLQDLGRARHRQSLEEGRIARNLRLRPDRGRRTAVIPVRDTVWRGAKGGPGRLTTGDQARHAGAKIPERRQTAIPAWFHPTRPPGTVIRWRTVLYRSNRPRPIHRFSRSSAGRPAMIECCSSGSLDHVQARAPMAVHTTHPADRVQLGPATHAGNRLPDPPALSQLCGQSLAGMAGGSGLARRTAGTCPGGRWSVVRRCTGWARALPATRRRERQPNRHRSVHRSSAR